MTQALILVNGFAASDDALPINTLVTLANDNAGGEVTYAWSITAQPPGTADALTSTNTLATTLTPTKEGNYRIQLIVNQGLGDERVATAIVGVLQVRSQNSQPAAGETTELGPQGWAPRMNQTIRLVDQLNADPGCFICATPAGEATGTPVTISGAQVILSGLPGETTVPTVAVVDAAVAVDVAGPVGVILGTVDGGAVGPGSLVYVRMNGLASVPVGGSPVAGTALAAAGTPAATIVPVSSLGPTDPYRYVGVSCGADPITGANTLIAWAGAGAQVAGGSPVSNVVWKWNTTSLSQFSGNPLPGPGYSAGPVTNAELAVAPTESDSSMKLEVTADEIANGVAIWWLDQLVPVGNLQYRWNFTYPTPGPAAASSESVDLGIVWGGDGVDGLYFMDIVKFLDDGAGNVNLIRQVLMINPVDAVYIVLYQSVIFSGLFLNLTTTTVMKRDDTTYAGGTGVPVGHAQSSQSAWDPGLPPAPEAGSNGSFVISSTLAAPGVAWATAACNRVGVMMGGNWTTATSGAQAASFSNFVIESVEA